MLFRVIVLNKYYNYSLSFSLLDLISVDIALSEKYWAKKYRKDIYYIIIYHIPGSDSILRVALGQE